MRWRERVAELGAKQYPNHAELAKMRHILAPPSAVARIRRSGRSIQANQQWLEQHYEQYKRVWVALHNGELLAAAATARELRGALPDSDGVMVTRV